MLPQLNRRDRAMVGKMVMVMATKRIARNFIISDQDEPDPLAAPLDVLSIIRGQERDRREAWIWTVEQLTATRRGGGPWVRNLPNGQARAGEWRQIRPEVGQEPEQLDDKKEEELWAVVDEVGDEPIEDGIGQQEEREENEAARGGSENAAPIDRAAQQDNDDDETIIDLTGEPSQILPRYSQFFGGERPATYGERNNGVVRNPADDGIPLVSTDPEALTEDDGGSTPSLSLDEQNFAMEEGDGWSGIMAECDAGEGDPKGPQ